LAEPITQGGGEILGASFIDVDDDDFTRSQSQKGVSHSGAGSTGTELNYAIAADIGQFSPETLCEAPPIGIVPDAATVFQNDGVDGTECSCVGRELIKQGITACLQGWVILTPPKPNRSAAVRISGRERASRPSTSRSISL
jgi:hypothetical protein